MIDLHIIPSEKITISEIESSRKRFKTECNPFIIWGGPVSNDYSKYDNVDVLEENSLGAVKLLQRMKKADRIHIHGLFSFWLLGILAIYKSIGRKVVWDVWGDDLYCLTRPKGTISNNLHLWLRTKACSNIAYIATNVEGDYNLACKILGNNFRFFKLRFSKGYISGILPFVDGKDNHDGVNILVGNSATRTNFHAEAFEKLKRYVNEDIKIYVPLSYGSATYAEEVISEGKKIFGEKFCPLTDFMPKDEYFKFLMSIDVAVFANNRQQALGNIFALLYAGKKVYMRSDISSWETLKNEYDIDISDYFSIDYEKYTDFITNKINMDDQRNKILEMTDDEKANNALAATLISEKGISFQGES